MSFGQMLLELAQAATDAAKAAAAKVANIGRFVVAAADDAASGAVHAPQAVARTLWEEINAAFDGNVIVDRPVQVCSLNDLPRPDRMAFRKGLIETARQKARDPATPPERAKKMGAVAERLARNNDAIDDAKLAEHVYAQAAHRDALREYEKAAGNGLPVGDRPRPPELPALPQPSECADPADYGLSDEDLAPPGSTFRAEIYRNPADGRVVVAYRGTELAAGKGTDAIDNDLATNADSALGGESANHTQALLVADKMEQAVARSNAGRDPDAGPPARLSFTGHSLGGDYAQLAALQTGSPARGFNAKGAALQFLPEQARDPPDTSGLEQFHAPCDPLTAFQRSPALQAAVLGGAAVAAPGLARVTPWIPFLRDRIGADRLRRLPGAAVGNIAAEGAVVPMALGPSHEVPCVQARGADGKPLAQKTEVPCLRLAQHSITNLVDGMEQQKTDDIATLQWMGC